MKIVVLDGYTLSACDEQWIKRMEKLGELVIYNRTTPAQVASRCAEADAVLTNKVPFTAEVIKLCPKLRYIGILATGVNVVDLQAAHQAGITVTNIPAYSTMSVAQMVFALLLAITNRVEHYTNLNRAGAWSRCGDFSYWDTELTELSGMRLGIIGLGNIGMAVARIAAAFGMEVCAVSSKPQDKIPGFITKMQKDELLRECDVISLHCPLTADNAQMINAQSLAMMKPGAILINTGRGGLIDEEALADALNSGHLRAAGADVMAQEPPKADSPLLSVRNFFVTPHIAWATKQACERLISVAINNLAAFAEGRPQNVV